MPSLPAHWSPVADLNRAAGVFDPAPPRRQNAHSFPDPKAPMRAFALLLLVAFPALADDAGILRCRAIKESAARLSCYDALAVPSSPAASPSASPSTSPSASRAPAAPKPPEFGFEHKQEILKVEAVESTLPGRFEGWQPNEKLRLANGQVWQVVDDSKASLWIENPKVRVRRGVMGVFYLEIEGTNRSPRVKRLQ